MEINNNEHYDPSILSNLIQDLHESEDKSKDTLHCILHRYGVTISETFTVQDFINSCSDLPGVDKKSLEIFDLFKTDNIEDQNIIMIAEQVSEGASEKMKVMLQEQYDGMRDDNKPYPRDLEKLQSWKELDYREESGVKIVNVPGFGEVLDTRQSGLSFNDMNYIKNYKNGKKSIDNLKESLHFKRFASLIQGCDMMELSDNSKLMNVVAQQIGITHTIDENYINKWFEQIIQNSPLENSLNENHIDKWLEQITLNLPLEDPLGRILRALYMVFGRYGIVLFIDERELWRKNILTIGCSGLQAWISNNNDVLIDYDHIFPLAKISNSL